MPLAPGLFPRRFSEQQIRIVRMLRQWTKNHLQRPLLEENTYSVSTLVGQKERGTITPKPLREFGQLVSKSRQRDLLGYIVLACFIRGALAVRGPRTEWGALLDCCAKTAWSDLEYLVAEDWLVKLPQFNAHKSHGKNGEALHHRQLANCYAPGRKLKVAWQRHLARPQDTRFRSAGPAVAKAASPTAAKAARSSDGIDYHPSFLQQQDQDPSPAEQLSVGGQVGAAGAVCDGDKVSLAATVCSGGPSLSAPARNGAVSNGDAAPCGGRKTADQEAAAGGPAAVRTSVGRVPGAKTPRNYHMPLADKEMLDGGAIDIQQRRQLERLYRTDEFGADMARIFARNTAHSLDLETRRERR